MCCTCANCFEPLFNEEELEVLGYADDLPDLLWGASKDDVFKIPPEGAVFFEWREVDLNEIRREDLEQLSNPFIDLGPGGIYVGSIREGLSQTINIAI